jgi:hypothetical protein
MTTKFEEESKYTNKKTVPNKKRRASNSELEALLFYISN